MEIPDHGLYGLDGPVSLAVQRSAPGHWLLRAPSDDPLLPPVVLVAAVDAPDYAGAARTVIAMRSYPPLRRPETRAEYSNVDWRSRLLECARLLDICRRLIIATPRDSTCKRTR